MLTLKFLEVNKYTICMTTYTYLHCYINKVILFILSRINSNKIMEDCFHHRIKKKFLQLVISHNYEKSQNCET